MIEQIKKFLRFVAYGNERRKVRLEKIIERNQNEKFQNCIQKTSRKLIIFFVDGANWFTGTDSISGGILSIASLYEESKLLKDIHGAEVIMLTLPNAYLLEKHTQFPNDISVFRFDQLKNFLKLETLMVHIPEFKFKSELIENIISCVPYLNPNSVHLNILNQRLDLMPDLSVIEKVKKKGFRMTQTTAHENYSTEYYRKKFNIPLHKFSVFATPQRYNQKSFEEKDNLILVSPDKGELKTIIMEKLQIAFPDFRIEIIENLTYREYLNKVEKAKYTITFGEGLDFYFIESVFSGGVALAVYNEVFFTPDFKQLGGVFMSYKEMQKEIVGFLELTNNKTEFFKTNRKQFKACNYLYSEELYKKNLLDFYIGKYLFP